MAPATLLGFVCFAIALSTTYAALSEKCHTCMTYCWSPSLGVQSGLMMTAESATEGCGAADYCTADCNTACYNMGSPGDWVVYDTSCGQTNCTQGACSVRKRGVYLENLLEPHQIHVYAPKFKNPAGKRDYGDLNPTNNNGVQPFYWAKPFWYTYEGVPNEDVLSAPEDIPVYEIKPNMCYNQASAYSDHSDSTSANTNDTPDELAVDNLRWNGGKFCPPSNDGNPTVPELEQDALQINSGGVPTVDRNDLHQEDFGGSSSALPPPDSSASASLSVPDQANSGDGQGGGDHSGSGGSNGSEPPESGSGGH